jgi:transposase
MDTHSLKNAMETLINLPNTQIQDAYEDRDGNYIVTVISTAEGTRCHKCNQEIIKPNGYGETIVIRHLDILGKHVYIRISLRRYQCDCHGQPTTTQQVTWHTRKSPFTIDFERHLLLSCVNSTVSDVAIKEQVTYGALSGVIDRHVSTTVCWEEIERLDAIGIDEISLKEGHKDFVVIVTGYDQGEIKILGILKNREKATVKEFLLSIPKRLRKSVRYVCSDLYTGFINAAKEVFGKKVKVVADRFHVAKLYRNAFDDLRKKELNRLKKELSSEEYKKLKGAMWALRKKEEDLTEEEKNILQLLFHYSPLLKKAYQFRKELTAIFDRPIPQAQGKRLLNDWINRVKCSEVRCYDSFIKTLVTRKEEITNYFSGRYTSGFVEGLNNKIKVIKRRCYGILNIGHLFQRIYLDLFGYHRYL